MVNENKTESLSINIYSISTIGKALKEKLCRWYRNDHDHWPLLSRMLQSLTVGVWQIYMCNYNTHHNRLRIYDKERNKRLKVSGKERTFCCVCI